jgi:hypothetical protein
MTQYLKHVYYLAMLDAGEHWCIVCHARNSELAPMCPGHRLSPQTHLQTKKSNEMRYGVDRWVIRSTINEDVEAMTAVQRGDRVAP